MEIMGTEKVVWFYARRRINKKENSKRHLEKDCFKDLTTFRIIMMVVII